MNVRFPKILSCAMACFALGATALWPLAASSAGAEDPDLIFRKSTPFRLLTPNFEIWSLCHRRPVGGGRGLLL